MGSESSFGSRGSGTSSQPKKYRCDFENCDKTYSKPSLLEQHKRSHTNERPFRCTYDGCDKSFLRNSHLKAHEVSHQSQQGKPFHCSVCGKGVNSSQHLKRHEITHTKTFTCKYDNCQESFYKHQSLRHHILSVHDKSLTCTICNKSFSRPYRLAQHNLKFHSETPTYQCDFKGCFRNFKTWSALQLHVKTDHPKLKCSICGKGCVGKQGLTSHLVSHNADKNTVKLWNCDYCDLGQFVKKVDLISHYHEFHDGNLPANLLNPRENLELEESYRQVNGEYSSGGRLDKLPSFDDFNSSLNANNTSVDSCGPAVQDDVKSDRSLNSFHSALSKGTSVIDLLLKNYNHRRLVCPKNKCGRFFAKDYDLKRHLKWHDEQEARVTEYLASLEDNQHSELEITDSNLNDHDDLDDEINMNDMIDDELKRLQQNSLSTK